MEAESEVQLSNSLMCSGEQEVQDALGLGILSNENQWKCWPPPHQNERDSRVEMTGQNRTPSNPENEYELNYSSRKY